MPERKLLSLAEISAIEEAYRLGGPCLGQAAAELLRRWEKNLRDTETLMRLVFLSWYQQCEPSHLTGLDEELPSAESLIEQAGGEAALGPEARFIVGYLASVFPWSVGREEYWKERAESLMAGAAAEEPESALFECWGYYAGKERELPKTRLQVNAEIHARFSGRGALGVYLEQVLTRSAAEVYGRDKAT